MSARSGDTFVSRWSRQRAVLRVTGKESDGELLRIEFTAAPGSRVIGHRHLLQSERFEGGPGTSVDVPPGVAHGFRNAGDVDARFIVEFRPALHTAELFLELCQLERDALSVRKLAHNTARLRALASEHGDGFFVLAALPLRLQRLILADSPNRPRLRPLTKEQS